MSELEIPVVLGSTRPGCHGKVVADWAVPQGRERNSAACAGALQELRFTEEMAA
jgi:hypothetical protein